MSFSTHFFADSPDAQTLHFALHALGFPDAPRAERLLRSLAKTEAEKAALTAVLDDLIENLSRSAEPPRALLNLSNLCDTTTDKTALFERLAALPEARLRLARLLSWSQALSDFVVRTPGAIETVFGGGQPLSRGQLRDLANRTVTNLPRKEAFDALRRFRRAQFLRIGLIDLDSDSWRDTRDFSLVTRQISDLAQVVLEIALNLICDGDPTGFCVVLMGKGGARELNYSSDVDLIFLAENRTDAAQIGQTLLRELGELTPAGQLYRVDMRLRPDGGGGPLVTPFSYALSYYESYAGAWEWQALIKARVVAGDARLGRRFRKFTRSISWAKRPDDTHLREVFEMKKRSEATADGSDPRNVKSGPGGIRDAEWIVQQLQMMVGPSHPRARAKTTLRALDVLDDFDALSPEETRTIREGYLWLRVAEHRLQLWNEQAIRVLPAKNDEKAALARRLGCAWRGDAAARWLDEESARHQTAIRALCERLFWSFFHGEIEEIETLLPGAWRDKQQLARLDRLAHGTKSQPLPAPLSRQIRAALPGAMRGLENAANVERALVNFENLCEASGNRLSLLRSLAAAPRLGDAIWTILGGAQTLAETLIRYPQLLDMTANRANLARSKSADQARADCRAYCLTFRDRKAAMRRWRGRELLRIGLRDLLLDTSPHEITAEIALLAGACLDIANDEVRDALRPASHNIGFRRHRHGQVWRRRDALRQRLRRDFRLHRLPAVNESGRTRVALGRRNDLFLRRAHRRRTGLPARRAPPPLWQQRRTRFAARIVPRVFRQRTLRFRRLGTPGPRAGALRGGRWRYGSGADGTGEGRRVSDAVESGVERRTAPHQKPCRNRTRLQGRWKGRSFRPQTRPRRAFRYRMDGAVASHETRCPVPPLQKPNTRGQLFAASDAGLLSYDEVDALDAAYTWLRRAELRHQIAREGVVSSAKRGSEDAAIWAKAVFHGLEIGEAVLRFETEWTTHTSRARTIFERVRDEL